MGAASGCATSKAGTAGSAEQGEPAEPPSQFDKPTSTRSVPPAGNNPIEVRCTYYPDFMIRELRDGPTSQDAVIVRGANPPCNAGKIPGAVTLKTADMALDGRKGQALFFSQMDPHGAVNFVVLDAQSGRTLLSDAVMPAKPMFKTIAIEPGGLRLSYQRGINASCSLAKNPAVCIQTLTKEGKLHAVPAGQMPSPQFCSAAYKKANTPPDSPSILHYLNEVQVGADGKTDVISRGPFGCDALP